MRQFLEQVQVNKALREKVEQWLRDSAANFALARAMMDNAALDTALLVPKFEIKTRSADESNLYSYGLSFYFQRPGQRRQKSSRRPAGAAATGRGGEGLPADCS